MATLYVDFKNGNDSNDGTTFANRVQSITNGITAARTAPGDTIRIMKSEDPVSLGVNATFTNKSDTVTLASALTKNIDTCDAAWTASANVTSSTDSGNAREGTACGSHSVAAAFVTGVIAYKALGAVTDFSAYNKVSFWLTASTTIPASTLRLDLCSDAAGAVPVNSFTVTRSLSGGTSYYWYCLTYDNGSALGNNIQSVALYALSDPGTTIIKIDNIIACNALTLSSLVSLSSSPTARDFYPIKSINGTTIKIDGGNNKSAATTERGYSGTTTTGTCYKIEPISITTGQSTQEAGALNNRSVYSGGWDQTNMSTQTGLTFIDIGVSWTPQVSPLPLLTIGQSYLDFTRIVLVRGSGLTVNSITPATNLLYNFGMIGTSASTVNSIDADDLYCLCSGSFGVTTPSYVFGQIINSTFNSSNGYGVSMSSALSTMQIINCTFNNNLSGGVSASGPVKIYNCTAKDNGGPGFTNSPFLQLVSCTTSGNTVGVSVPTGRIAELHNCTISDTTQYSLNTTGRLSHSNIGGDATKSEIYDCNSSPTAQIVSSPVHGTTTKSWKHVPYSFHVPTYPFIQRLSPIAVASSGTFTFSIWVQRDSTNVGAKILLRGGQCAGITSDVSASASAAINTWEQLTITASPTQTVPIVIELQSWQISGSGNIYWGDASVSQA